MNNPRQVVRQLRQLANAIESGTLPKAAAAPSPLVCADDMLAATQQWGQVRDTFLTSHPAGPITPGMVEIPPQSFGGGNHVLTNNLINGTAGVNGGYAIRHIGSGNLTLQTVEANGWNYGLWYDAMGDVVITGSKLRGGGGGDDYGARIYCRTLTSSDTLYENADDPTAADGDKASFRCPECSGGSSTNDTFKGQRVMWGGGGTGEWDAPGNFHDFTCTGGKFIDTPTHECYNGTHHVTWDQCTYQGVSHISVQPGAHDLVWKGCTGLPTIRLYQATGGWVPLTAAGVPSRGIVIVP